MGSIFDEGKVRDDAPADPATIRILAAGMWVALCSESMGQHYIPGFSGSGKGNGTFDGEETVKLPTATLAGYKAMSGSPSESEWDHFSAKTAAEMSPLLQPVPDQAGATPSGASHLATTMCLMKVAKLKSDNKEIIDKNLAETER